MVLVQAQELNDYSRERQSSSIAIDQGNENMNANQRAFNDQMQVISDMHAEQVSRDTFQAQLIAMGVDMKGINEAYWTQMYERIRNTLADYDFLPNPTQFGCAIAILKWDGGHRRLLMMPSGQGKSRVIACLIAIRAHERTNYKQEGFTIVFSSALLRDVDAVKY